MKINKHKFISYDNVNEKYVLQILRKDIKPYIPLVKKRFKTLEEAIKERDNFLNNYKDKRYKGVSYHKNIKKWTSNVSLKGKSIHLGIHETQEEAKDYRNEILRNLMN